MEEEEKELLKHLLSKIENLEKEIKELKSEKKQPIFPPLKTTDRLTKVIVEKARKKIQHKRQQADLLNQVREIKKHYSFSEILRFALKKDLLPRGNPDKEAIHVQIER